MTAVARQIAKGADPEERMCALSRACAPRAELIRFVASPDGDVVPDLKEALPGRGMWLSLSRETVAEAIRRKLFARALKTTVNVDPDLAERVSALLKKDCLSTLSLASKAGEAVAGFDKVSAALERGSAPKVSPRPGCWVSRWAGPFCR